MSDPPASPDDETINISEFFPRLEPEVLGRFEGVSGLMLVNMPNRDFEAAFHRFAANASAADDVTLIGTINHETYHALQFGASGYGFNRQRQLFKVLNDFEMPPTPPLTPEQQAMVDVMKTEAGDTPDGKRRVERAELAVRLNNEIAWLDARAQPGDNSVFGALHPEFFRYVDALTAREAVANADGLSIQALLEGSAVAFTHLYMKQPGGPLANMEAELATLDPLYRQLYALTETRSDGRALELLLPTAALALQYAEPHNAYCALLPAMMESPPGEALAHGHKLATNPPVLASAGAVLGSSIAIRRGDDSYHIYDKFIDNLAAARWDVDAYTALAEPDSMNRVQSLPFALVTMDGAQSPQISVPAEELVARMAIMALVMRVKKRRILEEYARDFQVAWARDVLDRVVGSASFKDGPDTKPD